MVKVNNVNKGISTNEIFNDNFRNQNPKFKNPDRNFMNIIEGSAAIGKGNPEFSGFPDILTLLRTSPSDIGAYNFIL